MMIEGWIAVALLAWIVLFVVFRFGRRLGLKQGYRQGRREVRREHSVERVERARAFYERRLPR